MTHIPYGHQDIVQADIDAVLEVLKSDYLTQGPSVPKFEELLATYCNCKHAIAVNSATSALHLACMALGLKNGDWLWTTPISFVASANCGLYCGAKIDFVDIDPNTYNLCTMALSIKLELAERSGSLPKVLVVVHLCGQSCDMQTIHLLSIRYGFKIIEDASHAVGGKYKGEPIGNCRYSDITVFSFHPVKIITTAEGGMCLTNIDKIANKITLLRSHGITRDSEEMTTAPDGPWFYQQIELGYNYRMSELQAALGVSQLLRLNDFVNRRQILAEQYDALLSDLPVVLPWQHPDSYSSFHLYPIRLQLEKIDKSHSQVFHSLQAQGIGVNLHYIPIYKHPYYELMGFNPIQFPQAESYYQEAISLPLFYGLTNENQIKVFYALRKAIYDE